MDEPPDKKNNDNNLLCIENHWLQPGRVNYEQISISLKLNMPLSKLVNLIVSQKELNIQQIIPKIAIWK